MKLVMMLIVLVLMGCQNNIPFVHRPPLQQGNLLEQEKVDQIKVGMTRKQVNYILGEPISHDTFGFNRYDYVYYYKEKFEDPEYKKLTIYFDEAGMVKKVTQ